jgi:hypothetical protein
MMTMRKSERLTASRSMQREAMGKWDDELLPGDDEDGLSE